MKTALFIDLDDTIIQGPMDTGVFPYIFDIFRKYRPDLTHTILLTDIIDILESRYKDKRVDAFDWDELVYMVSLKYNIPEEFNIEKLIQDYAKPPYIRLHDHVIDALVELRKSPDRILAITTNGFWKYQSPTVKAFGLDNYFDYFCAPDLLGCLKGEKRFYQHILNGSQLAISIGDRYDADVEWPVNLGFSSIWKPKQIPPEIDLSLSPINRVIDLKIPEPFRNRPNAIIQEFNELPSTVDAIEKEYN